MRLRRGGVSLIELLIAITVVGIIAAAMTRLLLSNSRSTEVRNAERDARAVSRAAINLLESELRMVDPFGVIAPTNDSTLTVRAPYAFGTVCSATVGAGSAISTLPSAELPASLVVPGRRGWAWRDATGAYVYESGTSLAADGPADCVAAGVAVVPGGRVVYATPLTSGPPTPGSIIFLYRQLTYSLRASNTFPGRRGLFRTVGANGTPEELAAPFSAGSRFRFYIMNQLIASDTVPTFLDNLRGVQFILNGESIRQPRTSSDVARAPFLTSVFFQNRPS